MGKLLTAFWVPASIAVTALAIANIIESLHPGSVGWIAPFARVLGLYSNVAQQMSAPLTDFVLHKASFNLPHWAADSMVAYTASASGFAMAGTNLTTRSEQLHTLKSSIASMGWPLAILTFGFNAFRNREISKFAAQHTTLFVLYIAAVGGVLAAAIWGPHFLGAVHGA